MFEIHFPAYVDVKTSKESPKIAASYENRTHI
jgi:hypothetical protein